MAAETNNEKLACRRCFNARVCPPSDDPFGTPLTDENDGYSGSIGECSKGFSMMINAGGGKTVNITVMQWNDKIKRWQDIGIYYPKFCPECGRRLNEYDKNYERNTK